MVYLIVICLYIFHAPLSHFQDCEGRRWPVTVMTLAEAFELDTNVLKQFYATQLVSHGYDVLALEVCYYAGQKC